jgi:hypothetical protein
MSVCTPRNRALEGLVASAWDFARKEGFMAARKACSNYALAAFRHRGDGVLLLLSDELKEIECPHQPDPNHERDLLALAKLRSHPSFGATLDQIGDVRERCKAGGASNAAEAWSMLLQLLRGA